MKARTTNVIVPSRKLKRVKDLLISVQYGLCFLCGENLGEAYKKGWCQDHSHNSGILRAVLCSRCNIRIGNYETNHRKNMNRTECFIYETYVKLNWDEMIPSNILESNIVDNPISVNNKYWENNYRECMEHLWAIDSAIFTEDILYEPFHFTTPFDKIRTSNG